jgi:23S rRNA pseudouridine2605 synthase
MKPTKKRDRTVAPVPAPATNDNRVRLNKFLSMAGVSSRRQADKLLLDGSITVNGIVVTDLGHKIDPENDLIFVNGKQVAVVRGHVYILFNKPKDAITTTSDERGRTTVMEYLQVRERVFPIGRLDRNTTGVLLFTNDGELANRLMHPKHEIEKAYKATLDKPLEREHAVQLKAGIRLSEGKTQPAEIHYLPAGKKRVIGIVIREGKNRQVHRMFEALGYTVNQLDRVAYAGLTYEGVPRGRWRYLTKTELRGIKTLAGLAESASEMRG